MGSAGASGKKQRDDYFVKSVFNALSVLAQFHDDVAELSLSELSRLTGMSKNTVFRLLATLELRGYVEQSRINHFRLGIKCYELGKARLKQTDLGAKTRPVMVQLARDASETVCLAMGDSQEIYYSDCILSRLPVRATPSQLDLYPSRTTAAGKVFLACRYGNAAGDGLPIPQAEVKAIREAGFAIDRGETEAGAISIAAPIRDHDDKIVAALCILGPADRFTDHRIRTELGPLLVRSAQTVSSGLGHPAMQVEASMSASATEEPVAGTTAVKAKPKAATARRGRTSKRVLLKGHPVPAAS